MKQKRFVLSTWEVPSEIFFLSIKDEKLVKVTNPCFFNKHTVSIILTGDSVKAFINQRVCGTNIENRYYSWLKKHQISSCFRIIKNEQGFFYAVAYEEKANDVITPIYAVKIKDVSTEYPGWTVKDKETGMATHFVEGHYHTLSINETPDNMMGFSKLEETVSIQLNMLNWLEREHPDVAFGKNKKSPT